MEDQGERISFDMSSLRIATLPQKRGLSRYYSGKSRSFMCMEEVQCVDDLKKQEHPDAKRRKYSDRKVKKNIIPPPFPCRTASNASTTQGATPFVGAYT